MTKLASKNTGKISLAVALLLAAGTLAQANTVTYANVAPINLTLTDWANTLALPQFNPALGTLNSVSFSFNAGMSTTLTVQNQSPSLNSSGSAHTELQLFVDDAGLNLMGAGNPWFDMNSASFNFSNLAPLSTVNSALLNKSQNNQSGSSPYTDSIVLSEFTGSGNYLLDAHTYTQAWIAYSGGNSIAIQVTDAYLNGSVTYDYTAPVPEPSSALFLGLGGLALLGYRRFTR